MLPEFNYLLKALAALAAVLGLVLLVARLARASGFGRQTNSAGRVLSVEDSIALDPRRRLQLVRCADKRVLLLTGGAHDVVVGWLGPDPIQSRADPARVDAPSNHERVNRLADEELERFHVSGNSSRARWLEAESPESLNRPLKPQMPGHDDFDLKSSCSDARSLAAPSESVNRTRDQSLDHVPAGSVGRCSGDSP